MTSLLKLEASEFELRIVENPKLDLSGSVPRARVAVNPRESGCIWLAVLGLVVVLLCCGCLSFIAQRPNIPTKK